LSGEIKRLITIKRKKINFFAKKKLEKCGEMDYSNNSKKKKQGRPDLVHCNSVSAWPYLLTWCYKCEWEGKTKPVVVYLVLTGCMFLGICCPLFHSNQFTFHR
jgi:hypothetical protein